MVIQAVSESSDVFERPSAVTALTHETQQFKRQSLSNLLLPNSIQLSTISIFSQTLNGLAVGLMDGRFLPTSSHSHTRPYITLDYVSPLCALKPWHLHHLNWLPVRGTTDVGLELLEHGRDWQAFRQSHYGLLTSLPLYLKNRSLSGLKRFCFRHCREELIPFCFSLHLNWDHLRDIFE